jgi:hypothetical protein
MKEAPGSSETSVLTRTTRRNNPEDTTLHSQCRENLISYIFAQLLLALASVVTLGSKSRRTRDHILLFHMRLGPLSVASYRLARTKMEVL